MKKPKTRHKNRRLYIMGGFLGLGMLLFPSVAAQASASVDGTATSVVTLPIYPEAISGHADQFPLKLVPTSGWEAGSARFAIRTSMSVVTSWYRAHMKLSGFQPESHERVKGIREVVPAWYVSQHDPGLTVQISYTQSIQKPGIIWVSYYVTELPFANKPAAALVSEESVRMVVHYRAATLQSGHAEVLRVIENPILLRQLINDINVLGVDLRKNVTPEPGVYGGATLVFENSVGATKTVRVDFRRNEVQVAGISLFDPGNKVWLALSKLMGETPYPNR